MRDPREGLDPDGHIVTGAARHRVNAVFEPLLQDLTHQIDATVPVYLYGSVATGQAIPARSDLDVVALGLDPSRARQLSHDLTQRWSHLVRDVGIGAWGPGDLAPGDAGHGNHIFLKHYCISLSGPDPAADLPRYAGDRTAARGFNGDLPRRLIRWHELLQETTDADRVARLGRGIARKTLFATAGMVSVHDRTWTTDRRTAAQRWSQLEPHLAEDLGLLLRWGDGGTTSTRPELVRLLNGTIPTLVTQFTHVIGAWGSSPGGIG